MMTEFRIIEIARELANAALGIALLGGGALIARRSIAAGTWLAIAGFVEVSTSLTLHVLQGPLSIRYQLPFDAFAFVPIVRVIGELGAIALAIRALPSRVRTSS
jgi:hypothetical protein